MKELDIDCMKYRTSTHIASVDVDSMIAENGKCELTIKQCYYEIGVPMNGKKVDGYYIIFVEDVKDMKVNSGNRKIIADQLRRDTNCTPVESRKISNWKGMKIGLLVDPNVKFGKETVGGIIVDKDYKEIPKLTIQDAIDGFNLVDSRESFVIAMRTFDEFMANEKILSKCKELAAKFPKPIIKKEEDAV